MNILILGAGEVGAHLARVLSSTCHVVLIDRDEEALASVEDGLDVLTVMGDITHRKALEQAGAAEAAMVVAVTGSDDANLVGAALAAELGANRTVARVDDASFYRTNSGVESGVLGIHAVLCAARLVGDELVRLITQESADSVTSFARNALSVATIQVRESHPVWGKSTASLPLEKDCQLALVVRDGRARPLAEIARTEVGDVLVLSGDTTRMVVTCRNIVGGEPQRGMVIGGGDVGLQFSRMLSTFEKRVQLIERNAARAEFVAEKLPAVNVIRGDGSSIATLRDEHIQSVDYVAALTRTDEVNLMVSLIAREMGVKSTYTLVHRPGYEEIYRHLGVHGTTGPHDVLAAAVERLLPRRRVQGGRQLKGTSLECIEYVVPKSLREPIGIDRLALPPGVFLIGRAKDEHEILHPQDPIGPEQTLVLAAPEHKVHELEQRLGRMGRVS